MKPAITNQQLMRSWRTINKRTQEEIVRTSKKVLPLLDKLEKIYDKNIKELEAEIAEAEKKNS